MITTVCQNQSNRAGVHRSDKGGGSILTVLRWFLSLVPDVRPDHHVVFFAKQHRGEKHRLPIGMKIMSELFLIACLGQPKPVFLSYVLVVFLHMG